MGIFDASLRTHLFYWWKWCQFVINRLRTRRFRDCGHFRARIFGTASLPIARRTVQLSSPRRDLTSSPNHPAKPRNWYRIRTVEPAPASHLRRSSRPKWGRDWGCGRPSHRCTSTTRIWQHTRQHPLVTRLFARQLESPASSIRSKPGTSADGR